jgi:hypothetical protein
MITEYSRSLNMPLQIRRGTEAERIAMTQPLAAGELLYITSSQRLYIGNGSTLGGIAVTGYTNEDAQDAVASMFTGGSHSSISFTYNDSLNRIDANVNLSNYNGVIKADAFKGSLFADDGSTLSSQPLVDAISGTFNGNLVGNILTAAQPNITSLGTLTSLAVSGAISGASVTGNIFTSLIDSADSSTITVTPRIRFESDVIVENEIVVPKIIGNLYGQIISNDSVVLVNNATKIIGNEALTIDRNNIRATNSNILRLQSTQIGGQPVEIDVAGALGNTPAIAMVASYGTIDAPTDHSPGNEIAAWQFKGRLGGSFKEAVGISAFWSSTADTASATPDSTVFIATRNNVDEFKVLSFDHRGVLNVPVFKTTGYATGSFPTSPEEGWMIFDSSTKQFKGWNGSAWVVLG